MCQDGLMSLVFYSVCTLFLLSLWSLGLNTWSEELLLCVSVKSYLKKQQTDVTRREVYVLTTDCIKAVDVAAVTSPVSLWTTVLKPLVWHICCRPL